MLERIDRAFMVSIVALVCVMAFIFLVRLISQGPASLAPPVRLNDWESPLFWTAVAAMSLCTVFRGIAHWLAPIIASYHEGRALFVRRILAHREVALLERIARLERVLARTADRDGVLHARGLEITDAEGAPILVAAKDEHGVTRVTVGGEAGGTAASIIVKERGCGFEMRDEAGRLRIRTAVHRGDAWLTVFDAKEEPRAGFLVTADGPRLLLDRPTISRARDGVVTPGYL